ncbi:hypothetical protein HZB02_07650 [Candidatus Woesearchaeota archaeon]|nr:hypothetical protein [Candidatus Woesearchaeota archaeon]
MIGHHDFLTDQEFVDLIVRLHPDLRALRDTILSYEDCTVKPGSFHDYNAYFHREIIPLFQRHHFPLASFSKVGVAVKPLNQGASVSYVLEQGRYEITLGFPYVGGTNDILIAGLVHEAAHVHQAEGTRDPRAFLKFKGYDMHIEGSANLLIWSIAQEHANGYFCRVQDELAKMPEEVFSNPAAYLSMLELVLQDVSRFPNARSLVGSLTLIDIYQRNGSSIIKAMAEHRMKQYLQSL